MLKADAQTNQILRRPAIRPFCAYPMLPCTLNNTEPDHQPKLSIEILRLLQVYAQTHQMLTPPAIPPFRPYPVLPCTLNTTETGHRRYQPGTLNHPGSRTAITVHQKGDHASECSHLISGDIISGMALQARKEDLIDGRMHFQKISDPYRVFIVGPHPPGKSSQASQHQPAVLRRRHRSGRSLNIPDTFK